MTKRILLPVLAVAALGVSLTGCVPIFHPGNGSRVTDDRSIDSVEAVQVDTDGDLTVTVGDKPSLTITAPQNVIDRLTSDIVDGVLVLGVKTPQFGFDYGDIDYHLTVPRLSAVSVQGSSDVTADFTGADEVTIDLDGSGDIHGEGIAAKTVTTSVDGSGDIELDGTTDTQTIRIDGSADFGGSDLISRATTIELSGSGDIEVHATETLDVDLSGSGEVRYRGGAKVDSDISGSGNVVED